MYGPNAARRQPDLPITIDTTGAARETPDLPDLPAIPAMPRRRDQYVYIVTNAYYLSKGMCKLATEEGDTGPRPAPIITGAATDELAPIYAVDTYDAAQLETLVARVLHCSYDAPPALMGPEREPTEFYTLPVMVIERVIDTVNKQLCGATELGGRLQVEYVAACRARQENIAEPAVPFTVATVTADPVAPAGSTDPPTSRRWKAAATKHPGTTWASSSKKGRRHSKH